MEGKEIYEMEGSGDAYALDRLYQLIEPEMVMNSLGSYGMGRSSSFDAELGSVSYFSIMFISIHNIT